jgi:predicted 3-demethylubiquinone-9 3-methyltransferase (glyoxalase superfamily)
MFDLQHKITPFLWYDTQAEEASALGGWLQDRFGLSWQIVPRAFLRMMSDPDPARVTRVTKAMLQMTKFDVAALQRAYELV